MLPAALLCQREKERDGDSSRVGDFLKKNSEYFASSIFPLRYLSWASRKMKMSKEQRVSIVIKPGSTPPLPAADWLVVVEYLRMWSSLSFFVWLVSLCLPLSYGVPRWFWKLDAYLMRQAAPDAHLDAWTTPPCAKLSARTSSLQAEVVSCWVELPKLRILHYYIHSNREMFLKEVTQATYDFVSQSLSTTHH